MKKRYKVTKKKSYQEGGQPQEQPQFTMIEAEGKDKTKKIGGDAGETILNLDGNLHDIIGPSHKKGGIDILAQTGAYVFSDNYYLKKGKEREEDYTGFKEGGGSMGTYYPLPKSFMPHTLDHLIGDDKLTPAEVSMKIRKQFKLKKEEDDLHGFALKTFKANQQSAIPYYQELIQRSEDKKKKKTPKFKQGGYTQFQGGGPNNYLDPRVLTQSPYYRNNGFQITPPDTINTDPGFRMPSPPSMYNPDGSINVEAAKKSGIFNNTLPKKPELMQGGNINYSTNTPHFNNAYSNFGNYSNGGYPEYQSQGIVEDGSMGVGWRGMLFPNRKQRRKQLSETNWMELVNQNINSTFPINTNSLEQFVPNSMLDYQGNYKQDYTSDNPKYYDYSTLGIPGATYKNNTQNPYNFTDNRFSENVGTFSNPNINRMQAPDLQKLNPSMLGIQALGSGMQYLSNSRNKRVANDFIDRKQRASYDMYNTQQGMLPDYLQDAKDQIALGRYETNRNLNNTYNYINRNSPNNMSSIASAMKAANINLSNQNNNIGLTSAANDKTYQGKFNILQGFNQTTQSVFDDRYKAEENYSRGNQKIVSDSLQNAADFYGTNLGIANQQKMLQYGLDQSYYNQQGLYGMASLEHQNRLAIIQKQIDALVAKGDYQEANRLMQSEGLLTPDTSLYNSPSTPMNFGQYINSK